MYECQKCNFKTKRINNYERHLITVKHIKNTNPLKIANGASDENNLLIPLYQTQYNCQYCNKRYKYYSGLTRHNKFCISNNDLLSPENKELNTNLSNIMSQQKDQIQVLINSLEKSINNNNILAALIPRMGNTTNINNQMTINVFLNKTCKNAININEFIDQVKLTTEDLMYTKDNGFVKGIANIFIKNLADLEPTSRPIHCSDSKTMQFYIKDHNKWEKDIKNIKINKSIDTITQKQIRLIKEWENSHPYWNENDEEIVQYMALIKEVMGAGENKVKIKNYDSIKRDLSENVSITMALIK